MKVKFQALSSVGEVDVDRLETIGALRKKVSALLDYPAAETQLTIGCTLLTDDAVTLEDCKFNTDVLLSVVRSQDWGQDRLGSLKEMFLKQGELHSDPKSRTLLRNDAVLPRGLELPSALQRLFQICAKWNFTKNSYDVFNCNLFLMSPDNSDIFGDDDLREEWNKSHAGDFDGGSCAGKDWACFGATSEYDFYFVNICSNSPIFGSTRRVVNNCDEEYHFTQPPFERFLDVVEAYARTNSAKKPENGEDSDIEYDPFEDFNPQKKARNS